MPPSRVQVKSEIRKQALIFPPEDVINFTSMSERALSTVEEKSEHKILSNGRSVQRR